MKKKKTKLKKIRTLDSFLVEIGESLRARLSSGRHGSCHLRALNLVAEPGAQILRACAENAPWSLQRLFELFSGSTTSRQARLPSRG